MPKPFSQGGINQLTSTIIGAAIKVHRELGPGLLENAYFACLCLLLTRSGLKLETQKTLPLVFEGVHIDCAYRADLLVNDLAIVEVKALDTLAPVHLRQLRTYAKLADCPVGLLLNFGAPVMKDGIKRILNGFPTMDDARL
jgi:GxxExxY protein